MPFSDNNQNGPPPVNTPITAQGPDEFGVPWQQRKAQGGLAAGNLNTAWAQWFQRLWARIAYRVIERPTGTTFATSITPILYRCTQANLSALAATLYPADIGLLVEVTDYAHVLRWTGSAWEWGPGESGSGYVAAFAINPTGSGWQLCDGTTVAYLKSDGTTANYATPDLVTSGADTAFLKLGNPVSGPNAATAPTFTGGSIDPAATGITASTSATAATQAVQAGVGATVPTAAHTHAVSIVDPTHTHTIGSGAVGDDGEPRNMVYRPYFRR